MLKRVTSAVSGIQSDQMDPRIRGDDWRFSSFFHTSVLHRCSLFYPYTEVLLIVSKYEDSVMVLYAEDLAQNFHILSFRML